MPALHLDDVTAGYAGRTVLDRISVACEPGTVTALLGPNGAGKSTLLRIAGGTLVPRRGRVLVEGVELATLRPRERARRVASVGQEEAVEFPFTVREVVGIGRYARRGDGAIPAEVHRDVVDRALAALSLDALAERPLPTLSGGERRRAFLARALVQETPVLLLDEPTAHLDVGHEAALIRVVREIARSRGTTVLLALHDLNLVGLVADRVVVLRAGGVMASGPVDAVLRADVLSAAFDTPLEVLSRTGGAAPVVVPRSDS